MQTAEQLWLAGIPTFPLILSRNPKTGRMDKRPAVKGSWRQCLTQHIPGDYTNYGVPIPEGVLILDVDSYKDGASLQAIEQALGCSLPWDAALIQTTVSGGTHYAFKAPPYRVGQGKGLPQLGLDLRVGGKGLIASGAGYQWHNAGLFMLGSPDRLPELPEACRAQFEDTAPDFNYERTPPPEDPGEDVEEIKKALAYLDPSAPYDGGWIRTIMSLRHHFENDLEAGHQIAQEWSAGEYWQGGEPHNYDPHAVWDYYHNKVKSRRRGDTADRTIGSVIHEAKQHGYTPPVKFVDAAAAFASDFSGFLHVEKLIHERAGIPGTLEEIIRAIQGAGLNEFQVAELKGLLELTLKDHGSLNKETRALIDKSLQVSKPSLGTLPADGRYLTENELLNPEVWEYTHTTGKNRRPKGTYRNFLTLLNAYGVSICYDVIGKKMHVYGPTVPRGGVLQDDAAVAYLFSIANLNGFPVADLRRMLGRCANDNAYNPVKNWVMSQPWDGRDHVGELFKQIRLDHDEDPRFCEILFRKWLRGAYAIGSGDFPRIRRWEHVLVFVDPDGGAGKTRFFETLCPPEFRADGVLLDPTNKDSTQEVLSRWLVELGELDGTFSRAEQSRLKAFFSRVLDSIRPPYGERAIDYPRMTAFMGTVNEPYFLIDQSNNRRFWPINVSSVNYRHSIPAQQVWAQIAHEMYAAGDGAADLAFLSPEESQHLTARNNGFRVQSRVSDIAYDVAARTGEADTHKSASELLTEAGFSNPSKTDLNEMARCLRRLGLRECKRQGKTGFLVVTEVSPVQQAFTPRVVK